LYLKKLYNILNLFKKNSEVQKLSYLFRRSKKFRISEFSCMSYQKFRSSEVLMVYQKFRSSKVLMGYQKFRCSEIPEIPQIQVQKFKSSTSSQLLGGLNSSYLPLGHVL
jgi:hypothetical protein